MFSPEKTSELISSGLKIATDQFSNGRIEDAEIVAKQVLKVEPDNQQGLQLLGLIKHKKNENEKAIEIFEKALSMEPDNIENQNNLALSYAGVGNYSKSIELFEKAANMSSKGFIYSNLALQYRNNKNIDKAIENFEKALKLEETAATWGMLGGCFGEQHNLDKAESCFRKALAIEPNFAPAHVDMASIYQLRGEWTKAWEEYEWRFEVYQQTKFWQQIYEPEKKWKGESLNKKRIMVYSEQGIGDAIHFMRYVPLLKTLGAHTVIHCWDNIESLFKPLADETYTKEPSQIPVYHKRPANFDIPNYDYHCSAISLPYLLKCEDIPKAPYLHTTKTINLDDYKGFYKIGIVWGGNPQHPNDANRSCKLRQFRPIYELPNVKLFSLQKDTRSRAYRFEPQPIDLTEGAEDMQIVDVSEFMNSFEDTATIIKGMDLVISVDTAVSHLAGALNHPVWMLLAWNPDWRWKLIGDTTEWYSSAKLFRQPQIGDWDSVFQTIKDRIKNDYLLPN